MFKVFLLVFCIVVLTINACWLYYFGGESEAFNTGAFYVLSVWVLRDIIKELQ